MLGLFFSVAPQLVLILSALYLGMHLTSSILFRAAGRIYLMNSILPVTYGTI